MSRTTPVSNNTATCSQPIAVAMSRKKGISTYETTPIAIDKPNHCEKLAMKPRYGFRARLAYM